ncbi:MAG: glycine--tRNA ligase, partial [Verrucomicrobiaceae bacterium]
MANKDSTDPARMEKIVSLCKRRGFIFQAGELYGGLNGCWDYGPLGAELKRNLKEYWWRKTVQERDDVLGMDGAILTMPQVLKSSGHLDSFSDPMCDCLLSKARLRADQVPPQDGTAVYFKGAKHEATNWSVERIFAVLVAPGKDPIESHKTARKFYGELMPDKKISPKELELIEDRREEVTGTTSFNPDNGSLLTEPREFNLMFKTKMGASADDNDASSDAYLRPETAQSIFVQYKNVLDSNRIKLPFGIAQIGKSFRNEINPRNYTFRSR